MTYFSTFFWMTTNTIRWSIGALGLYHYFYPETLDQLVSQLYQLCLHSTFLKHDSAEPIIAVTSLVVWILGWYLYDKLQHTRNEKLWSEPSRQDRNGFFMVLFTYLLPIMVLDYFVPRRHLVLIPDPPSFLRLVFEIALGIFVYDCGFYFCHRLIHSPLFYKALHGIHHKFLPTTARETFRLSLTEVWIDTRVSHELPNPHLEMKPAL
jgi:hypothetical protein